MATVRTEVLRATANYIAAVRQYMGSLSTLCMVTGGGSSGGAQMGEAALQFGDRLRECRTALAAALEKVREMEAVHADVRRLEERLQRNDELMVRNVFGKAFRANQQLDARIQANRAIIAAAERAKPVSVQLLVDYAMRLGRHGMNTLKGAQDDLSRPSAVDMTAGMWAMNTVDTYMMDKKDETKDEDMKEEDEDVVEDPSKDISNSVGFVDMYNSMEVGHSSDAAVGFIGADYGVSAAPENDDDDGSSF